MSPSAATDRSGFLHELVLHSSTEEMLKFIVPFVQDGVAAEEPTLLAVRPETAEAVVGTVGASPCLVVLPAIGQPGRAASDLRATDTLLTDHSVKASRVRILNQEPTVPGSHWHEWRRLEAIVNLALRDHQAWAVCVYDQHALTVDRAEDLHATHPLIWLGGKHLCNARYQDPVDFIGKHMDAPPDPVEDLTPSTEFLNPSPATARAAVADFTGKARLLASDSENLVIATSEVVANALRHGQPPIVLRLWMQPGRVTVTVTDIGTGPTDPFVGLLPAGHPGQELGEPGLGLWISHQLVDITHRRHSGGYTVRLTATHRDATRHDRGTDPR